MHRRAFIASSLVAPALAVANSELLPGEAANLQTTPAESGREYYELRRYQLSTGPGVKLAHSFFQEALIPAANRLGIRPVGIFSAVVGPNSPSLYVLLPSTSLETLALLDSRLMADQDYAKAGAAFLEAPATSPAYIRMESSLMIAFEGWPKIQVPASTLSRPRVFELRTYESPSDRDHVRKVEMFNSGEFEVFRSAGFRSVFYGDTLVGSRLPNLTYMLEFDDLGQREKLWSTFGSLPEWKKLSGSQRYAFEEIVSSITNVILSPTPYSQI
ncbi:MAG TPA: NIPSNAP family protein [Terriglobia bacterium]|nr:NIPSNAP family protein [Terriglobia bacterium]